MNKYYATLCIQDGNAAIEIDAPSREEARTKMFDHYGKRWAFLYDESERAEAIDAFNTPIINRI